MMRLWPIGIVPLLAVAACADLTDTKRWSSARDQRGDGTEVQVRVYVAPPASGDTGSTNPLSALSDRGQAAYVTALAARYKSASEFHEAVFKPNGDGPAPSAFSTIDREKRLLILTLTRPTTFAPGDRVMRAVVRVQPVNFTFGGYTVAQTDRQTVDITTLTRTSSTTGTLSVSAPSNAPVGGSASLEGKREIGTTTKLSEAPEKFTVDMVPSCMRVVQEGAHSVDITGNIRIALSLLTEARPVPEECNIDSGDKLTLPTSTPMMEEVFVVDGNLGFKGGRPDLAAGKNGGSLRDYPQQGLAARVTWEYVLRHVVSGAQYYDESEQGVALIHGSNADCQTIMTRGQFLPPLYAIYAPHSNGTVTIGRGRQTSLVFTTMDAARLAANWINSAQPSSFGSQPLFYDRGYPVGAKRYSIDTGDDACPKPDVPKAKT
jgi:hypothetical protein